MLHVKSLVLVSALLALASCGSDPTRPAAQDNGLRPVIATEYEVEQWAMRCSVRIDECGGVIYTTTDGQIRRIDNTDQESRFLAQLVATRTTQRITGVFILDPRWSDEYFEATKAYYAMN